MPDHVANIRRHPTLVQPSAHEADGGPVFLVQVNALSAGNILGEGFGPICRVDQIALGIQSGGFGDDAALLGGTEIIMEG